MEDKREIGKGKERSKKCTQPTRTKERKEVVPLMRGS